VYCYRRAHLASIGLAIAASCDEDELTMHGGNLGANLFAKSRATEAVVTNNLSQRRKISLSTGPIRQMASLEEGSPNATCAGYWADFVAAKDKTELAPT
jgi:hypothetical protein